MTTTDITPFQMVSVEAAEVVSFWPHIREDSHLGPPNALKILALWAHLRRFSEKETGERTAINRLVEQDAQQLLHQFFQVPSLGNWNRESFWIDDAKRLRESWDCNHTQEEINDLELESYMTFLELDRYGLAVYAADKLLPADHELREKLRDWQKALWEAEDFLSENDDMFFSSGKTISACLAAYREDLQKFDMELWKATEIYVVVKECFEEGDIP